MLSARPNFQSINLLSDEQVAKTLTADTFFEDVTSIAKLLSEGRLSQEDSEFVLSLLLALYVNDEIDAMTDEFEGLFEQMIHSFVPSAEE